MEKKKSKFLGPPIVVGGPGSSRLYVKLVHTDSLYQLWVMLVMFPGDYSCGFRDPYIGMLIRKPTL